MSRAPETKRVSLADVAEQLKDARRHQMVAAVDDAADGERVGVEFGTTGITSPTGYSYINGDKDTIYAIAQRALVETNRDIRFTNVRDRGFILITARRDETLAELELAPGDGQTHKRDTQIPQRDGASHLGWPPAWH